MRLDIIFEDEYMIAVVKPAGVSSQQDRGAGEDLYTAVQNYLFDQKQKDMASMKKLRSHTLRSSIVWTDRLAVLYFLLRMRRLQRNFLT